MAIDCESMCSQPTVCYCPDYKSFKFTEKNEGMNEEKAHDKSDLEDRVVSNLKGQDSALNGSEEISTERKSHSTDSEDSVDYELPELVVFLQENSYHFVKNMCIDKGTHAHCKCLVENCELDHEIISCLLESDANGAKTELKPQTMVTLSSVSKESKTTDEHNDHHLKNGSKQKESASSMKESLDFNARDEVQKAVSTSPMVPQKFEKQDDNSQETTSRKNSCDSATTDPEEVSVGPDVHQQAGPDQTGNISPVSKEDEPNSHIDQHFSAESSHFSSGHFSPHIAAHHGAASPSFRSISHRSNSSTTSSRSFAFPILAPEWHSSPERMVTPEKRQLRTTRQGRCARFLCCKFF